MENKLSTIKERILYIIELKGDKKENFFKKINMTYGSFKGSAKKRPLNSDAIANILSIYTDINPIWLLTGEGDMLNLKRADEESTRQIHDNKNELNMIRALSAENALLKKELKELKKKNTELLSHCNLVSKR
jgi:hypothetical protein